MAKALVSGGAGAMGQFEILGAPFLRTIAGFHQATAVGEPA